MGKSSLVQQIGFDIALAQTGGENGQSGGSSPPEVGRALIGAFSLEKVSGDTKRFADLFGRRIFERN
jgi:nicotinamide mononucleotide (NMN) deamidase PncC